MYLRRVEFWLWLLTPAAVAVAVQLATQRWHAALVAGVFVALLGTTLVLNRLRPDSGTVGLIAAYAYALVIHLPVLAATIGLTRMLQGDGRR